MVHEELVIGVSRVVMCLLGGITCRKFEDRHVCHVPFSPPACAY